MATRFIKPRFGGGEIAPELWGNVDLAKVHDGCSTMRNFLVDYKGGAMTRAGTKFIMPAQVFDYGGPAFDDNPGRLINFQFNVDQSYILVFGDFTMKVIFDGASITEAPVNITGITQANPGQVTAVGSSYSNGDLVYISGVNGMVQVNGRFFQTENSTTDSFKLQLPYGPDVNTTGYSAYTSGGTVQRVYNANSPYAIEDLPWLKFTQSADTMTICCVNQDTGTEYPPYELTRFSNTSWVFTPVTFGASISPPTSTSGTASVHSQFHGVTYGYEVTAIDRVTGDESVASPIVTVTDSVDISITAGSITIGWSQVTGASAYNIYKASPAFNINTSSFGLQPAAVIPVGAAFGFAGTALGSNFIDSNIVQDFSVVPPLHLNPFARNTVLEIDMTSSSNDWGGGATVSISSSTGTGFIGQAIIPFAFKGSASDIEGVLVINGGQGYSTSDTVIFTGSGSTASATLVVGPSTGTYPSVPSYFQQRRVYANSENEPDTYWMSQPGSYDNFDSAIPTIDSDAITGTPWAQQVNGIQSLVNMPAGLIILTGLGAWQLTGGYQSTAITPANQNAQPQAYIGCHNHVPPIVVNYDILFVQQQGAIIRDLVYNFFTNVWSGTDITALSYHLFAGEQIREWCWSQEAYKVIWTVLEDGDLRALTFLKEQEIYGWSRHDTNGLFVSTAAASEKPVNAPYFITKRFINGYWVQYVERMDDRLWDNLDSTWCVDCGLSYPMTEPNATLTAGATTGTSVSFTTNNAVFSPSNVGDVIRMGGGMATVTVYVSSKHLTADITTDITNVVPDSTGTRAIPATSGEWTITTPTATVRGLDHLEGATVTGLADGRVISPRTVTGGLITLDTAASSIVVGLGFQAQLQTLYMDPPEPGSTAQGQRKDIYQVIARVRNSRGLKMGTNQPDASIQPNFATVPWTNMILVKEQNINTPANQPIQLQTTDQLVNVKASWRKQGQVAIQQDYPLPAEVLALIPTWQGGDSTDDR